MRLHVVGLPHLDAVRANDWCAYTAKIRRLGGMLRAYGHEMILYAGPRTDADCELVPIVGSFIRGEWFGEGGWPTDQVFDRWNPDDRCWREMSTRAVAEIAQRIEPGDVLGVIAGRCQAQIADAFPDRIVLEWGVGYEGVLDRSFRAFESHAWRAYVAAKSSTDDIRWFDTVIPNAYGLDEFLPPRAHDGYLLFLGRPTERKGLAVVRELAQRFDVKCAGQSDPNIPGAEYVGLVTGDEKAKLLSSAAAVLAPTTYLEPFGGVAVEAQLAGVPAITTNYGAFTETVPDDWQCSMLLEFIECADRALGLKLEERTAIAARAAERWSTEAVSVLYDRWLSRITALFDRGWYQAA